MRVLSMNSSYSFKKLVLTWVITHCIDRKTLMVCGENVNYLKVLNINCVSV